MNQLLSEFGVHKSAFLLGVASNVIRAFETEFANSHDAKLSAISAIISALESYKNSVPEVLPGNIPATQT